MSDPAEANGSPQGHGINRPLLGPERLPPQNLECESGVLGSMLLDPTCIDDLILVLNPADFFRDSHQILCRAVYDLRSEGIPVDSISVEERLRKLDLLDRIGGLEAILQILASVPHAANAGYYAQVVIEKAIARDLIEASNETLRDGYANAHAAEELLGLAESRIFAIGDRRSARSRVVTVADAIPEAIQRIRDRKSGVISGMRTGFADLDNEIGGIEDGQYAILAARPSQGKTALAMNLAVNVASENRGGVLFVSLEMGRPELLERMLCAQARLMGDRVRRGILSANEEHQLDRARAHLSAIAPILIDDTPLLTTRQIAAAARRARSRHEIRLVLVDYLQIVEPENPKDGRQEQVAKISRGLRALAREIMVPVVALCQLNRMVENREGHRPRMADLRESGQIEQDADIVMLLHRPEYYDPNDQPGVAEIILAKNRNGATGTAKLSFFKASTRFENIASPFQQAEVELDFDDRTPF